MKVHYRHQLELAGATLCARIDWKPRFAASQGRFPEDHPCVKWAAAFARFLRLGYWAVPAESGDGINLAPLRGQSCQRVVTDIQRCFGWEVDADAVSATSMVTEAGSPADRATARRVKPRDGLAWLLRSQRLRIASPSQSC